MVKVCTRAVSGNIGFDVSKISDLDEIHTPEFIVRGIPWKVNVEKRYSDGEASLAVFLYCSKKNKTPDWKQPARFSIKLLSFISDLLAVKYCVEPFIYDHTDTGFGAPLLIKWKDLHDFNKGYIKNGTISLDVHVEVADSNEATKSYLICSNFGKRNADDWSAKYRLTVTNIRNLMFVRASKTVLRNISYHLAVYKCHWGNLKIYLDSFEMNGGAPTEISMSIKLTSSNDGAAKTVNKVEERNTGKWKILDVQIIPWAELMCPENGFIVNDSIIIEAEISIKRPIEIKTEVEPIEHKNVQAKRSKLECAICMEEMANKEVSSVPCGHMFCSPCIKRAIEDSNRCPSCNTPATVNDLRRNFLNWQR